MPVLWPRDDVPPQCSAAVSPPRFEVEVAPANPAAAVSPLLGCSEVELSPAKSSVRGVGAFRAFAAPSVITGVDAFELASLSAADADAPLPPVTSVKLKLLPPAALLSPGVTKLK